MSVERIIDILLAALGGGFLTAIVSFYRARAQNSLDSAQAWRTLLEQQQARVIDQQIEIDNLKLEIAERDGYIEKVIKLLSLHHLETPTYVFRRRYKSSKE